MRKEAAGENRRPCHRGGVGSASRASADKCRHPAVPGIAEPQLAVAVEAPGPEASVHLHCQGVVVAGDRARGTWSVCCRACMLSNPLLGQGGLGDPAATSVPPLKEDAEQEGAQRQGEPEDCQTNHEPQDTDDKLVHDAPASQRSWTSYDELPLRSLVCQRLYPGRCPCKRWRRQSPAGERSNPSALAALREPPTGPGATRQEAMLPRTRGERVTLHRCDPVRAATLLSST
jgi:hypothetical protein